MFQRKADRIIGRAHSRIADAELDLMHADTPEQRAAAVDELTAAHSYLRRAVATRDAWDAAPQPHDEYENYPEVPWDDQGSLL